MTNQVKSESQIVVIGKVNDNGHVKTISHGQVINPDALFGMLQQTFTTSKQVDELIGHGHIIRSNVFNGKPEDWFELESIESMETDLKNGTLQAEDWTIIRRPDCYFQVQVANLSAMDYRHGEHMLHTIAAAHETFIFKQDKQWHKIKKKQ